MSTTRDELDALMEAGGPPPNVCPVAWWLETSLHPDIGRLRIAVDNPSAPGNLVAVAFNDRGMGLSAGALRNHRRRACKCPR